MRSTNELSEDTTVHWHGMHLPAVVDGGPHQMIAPGQTREPEWTINQEPATLWFDPHLHGETERHVYNGLAGMFVLDPPDGPDTRLPHRYGVDDFPVVVQDKRFADDGHLDLDGDGLEVGLLGDWVMATAPGQHTWLSPQRRYGLRLLNGPTARVYNLGLSDDRDFQLVGTDGGLLAEPWTTQHVQLSPGERAEIVLGLRPSERVKLTSYGAELGDVVLPEAFGAEDVVDIRG